MAVPIVPQQLLRDFYDWHALEQAARRQSEFLRGKILQFHRCGARAQPGLFDFHVMRSEFRSLRKANLIELLGWDAYENLLSAVEPTVQERLTVFAVATTVATVPNSVSLPQAPGRASV